MDNHALLVVLVALVGISVFIQVVIMIGAATAIVALRKAITSAMETTADLKATIVPTVHSTRQLIEKISPQVITIAADIADIAKTVRTESTDVKTKSHEIMERVSKQTERLDAMLTNSLNVVERAGGMIESAVTTPVRQANGIFAAVKAVVETYRSVDPRSAARVRRHPTSSTAPIPIKAEPVEKDYVI